MNGGTHERHVASIRFGCLGFGGPPSHVVMLRGLCVNKRHWLTGVKFSVVGGLAFVVPGLAMVLILSALFLEHAPPAWVAGATT